MGVISNYSAVMAKLFEYAAALIPSSDWCFSMAVAAHG